MIFYQDIALIMRKKRKLK